VAAGVVRALMKRRRRQLESCPPGRHVPLAEALLVPTGASLRDAAEPLALGRLEAALAALSIRLAATDGEVPLVLGVVVEPDEGVSFYLDEPVDGAPAPFRATDHGQTWKLDEDALLGEHLDQAEPLLPALVGVGRTPTNQQVLVNLEAFGSVSVLGPGAADLLRTWVTDLATKPWTEFLEVVPIGFGDELAALESVRPAPSLEEVRSAMVTHAEGVARMVHEVGERSLVAARLHGESSNWGPRVICCAETPSMEELEPLRPVLADSVRAGVVLVAAGPIADAELVLDTAGEEMDIAPLGLVVRPPHLRPTELTRIGALVDAVTTTETIEPEDAVSKVSPVQETKDFLDPAAFFDEDEWAALDISDPKVDEPGAERESSEEGKASLTEEPSDSAKAEGNGSRGSSSVEADPWVEARRLAEEVLR